MLKQAVGVLASIVALAVVSLILAVLVRLSWGPRNDPSPEPSSGPDKLFRKA
ncbi:MAG: hypothetical protein ACM3OA_13020 [Acidobacteriota bacterium]